MKVLSRSRVLVLAITLLAGCRSEKVAFQFRPSKPEAVGASAQASAAEHATLEPVAGETAPAEAASPLPKPGRTMAVQRPKPARTFLRPIKHEVQSRQMRQVAARPQRPADDGSGDIFHVVLGSLVLIGGVILGFALGGWLGLGVGAAVVILGYYFLMLGIGGPHAWREIFQEFFNM